jgi:hypothetical protein
MVFAAGIVSVVLAALGLATPAPVQPVNVCPAGAAFALMPTTVPAAYVPLPVPPVTVKAYLGGVAVPTGTVIALLGTEPGLRTVNVAVAALPCHPLAVMLVDVMLVATS